MTFVLIEALASKQQGRTLWFKQMTGIGPMTTPERSEAHEFATKDEALWSPAMWHALSDFEVEEVSS